MQQSPPTKKFILSHVARLPVVENATVLRLDHSSARLMFYNEPRYWYDCDIDRRLQQGNFPGVIVTEDGVRHRIESVDDILDVVFGADRLPDDGMPRLFAGTVEGAIPTGAWMSDPIYRKYRVDLRRDPVERFLEGAIITTVDGELHVCRSSDLWRTIFGEEEPTYTKGTTAFRSA